MSHQHDHHHHTSSIVAATRAFKIAVLLNVIYILIEVAAGFYADSLSLLADAGHNISDVLGLVLAWFALSLSQRPPTATYTYGWGGASILAAMANALLLLVAIGMMLWEALHRLAEPLPVNEPVMMVVASVGIVINGLSAWLLMQGSEQDANQRGAFLHLLADALVSVGVVVAGLMIWLTGWLWLDAAMSLIIALVVLLATWRLLRQVLRLSLQAVPDHIDRSAVMQFLRQQTGVVSVHDLHVWAMSTRTNALTAHLVMPAGHPGDDFLHHLAHELEAHFAIHHATIQIELSNGHHACPLLADEVI